MPQVSKKPLRPELEKRIFEVLWQSLAKLNNKTSVSVFLEDLLTPTEKIMMAKRLAIAILLERGWSQEDISHTVKVSTSTVLTIKGVLRFSGSGYRQVIAQIEKDEAWEDIVNDLQSALKDFLGSQVGQNWRRNKAALHKEYRERLKTRANL